MAVVKGLLLLLAVAVVGAFAIVFLGVKFATNVDIEAREKPGGGGELRISTPAGTIRLDGRSNVDAGSFGVPVYPNAKLAADGGKAASIKIDVDGEQSKQLAVVGAVYRTDDTVEQVRAYYRTKLPNWTFTDRGFEMHDGGYKRIVVVDRKHGETHIALASIGEPAAH
jgi:hypothetical protein